MRVLAQERTLPAPTAQQLRGQTPTGRNLSAPSDRVVRDPLLDNQLRRGRHAPGRVMSIPQGAQMLLGERDGQCPRLLPAALDLDESRALRRPALHIVPTLWNHQRRRVHVGPRADYEPSRHGVLVVESASGMRSLPADEA